MAWKMKNLNKSNILTSFESINRTLKKNVEKIILKISVQNVPSSIKGEFFCSIIQGLKVYKALILPIMMYGLETWAVTLKETNMFRIFERKIVRSICGPLKEERWRIRTNRIKDMLEGEDTVNL
jgi:hypothetical protein